MAGPTVRAGDGPMTKRKMSTENDDDERENEDGIAHPGFDRQDRRDHDAGKAREHGAEAEYDHEQTPDIDAERGYHRRVGRAGAHQHADAGVRHEQVKQRRDGEPGGDDDEPP